jgi:hypothetical protein
VRCIVMILKALRHYLQLYEIRLFSESLKTKRALEFRFVAWFTAGEGKFRTTLPASTMPQKGLPVE